MCIYIYVYLFYIYIYIYVERQDVPQELQRAPAAEPPAAASQVATAKPLMFFLCN